MATKPGWRTVMHALSFKCVFWWIWIRHKITQWSQFSLGAIEVPSLPPQRAIPNPMSSEGNWSNRLHLLGSRLHAFVLAASWQWLVPECTTNVPFNRTKNENQQEIWYRSDAFFLTMNVQWVSWKSERPWTCYICTLNGCRNWCSTHN